MSYCTPTCSVRSANISTVRRLRIRINFDDSEITENGVSLNIASEVTHDCGHVEFKRTPPRAARCSFIMHLLFVFVSLIDKTNLIEQTQANIFASNSRDVARLVLSVQQCY
jgi:hypothetical protein